MRNSNLAILLIASFPLFFLTACSDALESSNDFSKKQIGTRTDNPRYHYYDNGLPDDDPNVLYGCTTPAINCAAEFQGPNQYVGEIFENYSTWGFSGIQDYFDENSEELSNIIGASETSGIIAGTYNLKLRGSPENGFLVVRSGTTVVSVTPVYE